MSTITKELAKLFRKITNSEIDEEGNAHVVLSPADSILINNARIALASLEAEAVAYMHHSGQVVTREECCDDKIFAICCKVETPLYAAPQLPQPAVPDMSAVGEMPFLGTQENAFVSGWNACRAAMLQAGNYPVTPDGLVSCGENCWSCGKYFTYEQHSECDGYCPHCDSPVDLDDEEDEQSKSLPANPTEEMISNAWREALGKCDHETIRRMYVAMFAAAPQQEVK
ncbi:hypothetical protein R1Z32_003810 [Citrobacter freundii]|nr:hypothetical protein [Citrobacter freundii]